MIIAETKETYEIWRSLGRLCNHYNYSHAYLKRQKLPFTFEGMTIRKNNIELY